MGFRSIAMAIVMAAVLSALAGLVPTTVLAQQHYTTACARFQGFPVNIGVLSRFSTPAQNRKVLSDLRSGVLDLVLGAFRSGWKWTAD